MTEASKDWPAGLFAVMQNGDGTPEYYRPWRPGQELQDFVDEVAGIVVRGIADYPYPSFSRVIGSETGEVDEAMTILVVDSMRRQRDSRSE